MISNFLFLYSVFWHENWIVFISVTSQLPAANSVALDMSLQTPSDVKVKKEEPVEVDSSPPGSPESISGKSDSNNEPVIKGKVVHMKKGWFAWGYRGSGCSLVIYDFSVAQIVIKNISVTF